MFRSFCVIVLQQSYHPATKETYSKYENYRVLVGAQNQIDFLKGKLEELKDFSFEVNMQVQAR